MLFSPSEALAFLEYYKYWIVFPIAIFEGPIIIIISGFLVYLGVLKLYIVYPLLVLADTIGDSALHFIGKYWRRSPRIKRFANFFGYTDSSEEFLVRHFEKHKAKTFLLGKFSHGLGSSVIIAGGIAGVRYTEFLFYSIVGTSIKTVLLMILGYYVGNSYQKIDGYLQVISFSVIGLAVLFILYKFSNKYIKKFFNDKNGVKEL